MLDVNVGGVDLRFRTEAGLFSPNGPDAGTLAMLSLIEFRPDDRVLDLGCGYGLVGILAAKTVAPSQVVMVDIDPAAVAAARYNADANGVSGVTIELSDGFKDTRQTGFSKILSNPPYHVDFSLPKHFIEKGFSRLQVGGPCGW
jgi:16S rRNA (guanine1207-N2)-methyltransferase